MEGLEPTSSILEVDRRSLSAKITT
jgi:hypothetical protein